MDPEIPQDQASEAIVVAPELATPVEPSGRSVLERILKVIRWIFLGPNGLRAGWKWLLFIFIFALATIAFAGLAKPFLPKTGHNERNLKVMFTFELAQAVIVLLTTGFLAKIVDRKK